MRLRIHSDLHLEKRPGYRIQDLIPQGEEILVLAGDIHHAQHISEVLNAATGLAPQVIFVPGNHEYDRSVFDYTHEALMNIDIPNVHVLMNSAKVIEGVKFYGGTNWPSIPPDLAPIIQKSIYDFERIEGMTAGLMDLEHRKFIEGLQVEEMVDVCISHFLPNHRSVHPQFVGQLTNYYFVADVKELIVKPDLWIHGHTHFAMDYDIHGTRVVCNPLGYPREIYNLRPPECIVEI